VAEHPTVASVFSIRGKLHRSAETLQDLAPSTPFVLVSAGAPRPWLIDDGTQPRGTGRREREGQAVPQLYVMETYIVDVDVDTLWNRVRLAPCRTPGQLAVHILLCVGER
jgi:hypothetical protein